MAIFRSDQGEQRRHGLLAQEPVAILYLFDAVLQLFLGDLGVVLAMTAEARVANVETGLRTQ